jgi:hypothetical protein
MVERANMKLGLERAMNADRANDGLRDGGSSSADKAAGRLNGPPQDRAEVDAMLKRGAHNIFLSEDDDGGAAQKYAAALRPCDHVEVDGPAFGLSLCRFSEADIDEILQSSSTKITYENGSAGGSVFSKAAFVADDNDLDMDDPEFWCSSHSCLPCTPPMHTYHSLPPFHRTKILPELQQKDAALAEAFLKRKSKQIKRFGMAEEAEVEEHLEEVPEDDGRTSPPLAHHLGAHPRRSPALLVAPIILRQGTKRKPKDPRLRDEEEAKRAARRAAAHIWSKTERMNCERALLSFG